MNLLEIFEDNERVKKAEEKLDAKREEHHELKEIISEIIRGDETHYTDNEDLLKKIGIKYKKSECSYMPLPFRHFEYERRIYFEYNKTNVKKIQKYLENQAEE